MTRYSIRSFEASDLPLAQQIRAAAQWNQTDADWQRLLDLEPRGCFVVEWDGQPAGTATTTVFDQRLGWIGMILVHPDYRRRGLATALIRRCLKYLLEEHQVECVKLDATPAGRQVYAKLGFQHEADLFRWERRGSGSRQVAAAAPPSQNLFPLEPEPLVADFSDDPALDDLQACRSIDRDACGVDRGLFLRRLAADSRQAVVARGPRNLRDQRSPSVQGFGMSRDGAVARYLGPVVAVNAAAAQRIIQRLLQSDNQSPQAEHVLWDLPADNHGAEQFATGLGFTRQRPLLRMWAGRAPIPGRTDWQWAIAGPETG